ncbi:MAG: hypothetical protein COB85_05220 [Bacteroidetes bacterium]|nr:MAG: hypothetical protein COB85_05220 [Bacteroidota bacterium]
MKKALLVLLLFGCILNGFAQELTSTIENAHAGPVLVLDLTTDEGIILSGGADKRAYTWNLKAASKIKGFGSHSGSVTGVAYSSNNKLFVTAGAGKRMIVYDAELGKPKKILTGGSPITSVAFNPINDNVGSGYEDGKVTIWDATAGKLIATLGGHTKSATAVSFSADGKRIATGSEDNTVKIWDAANGQLVTSIDVNVGGVTSLRFSQDGKYIAGGGQNKTVFMIDASTGNLIADHTEHKSKVTAVTFSPDVQFLASGDEDGKIIIWDVQTRMSLKELDGHADGTNDIVFGDKGTVMISGGNDGHIKIWDVTELNIGKKKFTVGVQKPKLICSALELNDKNGNGLIENDDKASLNFSIKNEGKGVAYDVVALVKSTGIAGLNFENEYFIGNLSGGKKQHVEIKLYPQPDMETTSGTFTVTIKEANNFNPDPLTTSFQSKGAESYSYIMIMDYKYSSATGKAAIGAPITLTMQLQNTSAGQAKDLKVNFLLPANVMATNKLSESIAVLEPGEMKEISMEFYATDKFTQKAMDIGLRIDGAKYTNIEDLDLKVTMKEELPVSNLAIAHVSTGSEGQPLYRGSGDPLKGLNVSRASSMQIGQYYALIIGIDRYTGTWPALGNAVNDAKAVEALLKSKYKFDHFRKLYDNQATREAIISEMEWLVANVKPQDNLFIYYSGHGEYKKELNKGYWVPVDASTSSTSKYISNSDIQTFMGGIRSKHTLLVSDACFSGDIFRGSTVMVPFDDSEKYYKEVHALPSRKAITSGGLEPVMDGGRDGHSVFAYYFLKVLGNNNKKYMDAGQLYDKIKIPVTNNSEQSPKFSPIKSAGDEGGQFIFIKR